MAQPLEQEQMQHIEVLDESVSHDIIHSLGESGIGLWVLLGFASIGFLTVFRKRIKAWLK